MPGSVYARSDGVYSANEKLRLALSDESIRRCVCGCGLAFPLSSRSRKIYYNRKHQKQAHAQRRKERLPALGETLSSNTPDKRAS